MCLKGPEFLIKKSQILNAYILLVINDEGLIDVSTEISDPLE